MSLKAENYIPVIKEAMGYYSDYPIYAPMGNPGSAVTVSPIGLSTLGVKTANNGAQFGPDTPGTTTQGLQEAFNYSVSQVANVASFIGCPSVLLLPGKFTISSTVTIPAPTGTGTNTVSPPEIVGSGHIATRVVFSAGAGFQYGQYAWQDAVIKNIDIEMLNGGTMTSLISVVGTGLVFTGARSWMMLQNVWFENDINSANLPSNGDIYFGPVNGHIGGFDLFFMNCGFAGSFSINSPFNARFVNCGVCAGNGVQLITNTDITTLTNCTIVGQISLNGTSNQQLSVSGRCYWNSAPTTGAVICSATTGTTHITIEDSYLLFLGGSSILNQTASATEMHLHNNEIVLNSGTYTLVQGGCYISKTSTYGGNSPDGYWAGVGNFIQAVTMPANPLVSATQYQNTDATAIDLFIPITYSPTGGAAATCVVALGPQSGASTIATETVPAGGPTGIIQTYKLRVPAGWYYKFTVTNATIGSGTVLPEQ